MLVEWHCCVPIAVFKVICFVFLFLYIAIIQCYVGLQAFNYVIAVGKKFSNKK